jgi:hypothetical protein
MELKIFLGEVGDCKASFAAMWDLHKHAKDKGRKYLIFSARQIRFKV